MQVIKKTLLFFTVSFFYSFAFFVFSASYDDVQTTSITVVIDIAARLLNILIASSGAIFAIYVIYAAVKLSLAWGDPKNFEGAKWSLFYSGVGFAVVLGFFTIVRIVLNLVGSSYISDPNDPFGSVKTNYIKNFQCIISGDARECN